MKLVELFAGAGGASLGLVSAGFTEERAVEWDKHACATRRSAGLRCDEGDVRDPRHYVNVEADAIWSSFPCQAWSTAGKRLGKNDTRNGWPWTVDVIDWVRPTWFMAENVPGLTHHRSRCRGLCADDCARLYLEQTILRQLGERFAWVGWRVIDVARFGVPQHRERLVIVAGPRPIGWPKETHGPPEEGSALGLFGASLMPWRTIGEVLGRRVFGGGTNPREKGASADRRMREITNEPSTCVPASPGGNALPFVLDAPAPAVCGGSAKSHVNGRSVMSANASTRAAMVGAGLRQYSVEEAAIVQDFPRDFPFQGSKQEQYRQVGNAVPPTLARVIGEAVQRAMNTR